MSKREPARLETTAEREAVAAGALSGEERYRALFSYAPDGIVIADAQGRFLDANPALCRMLGYERAEVVGRPAADFVAPAEVDNIAPAIDTIQSHVDYARLWQLKRKDGSTFPAEVMATPMPDGTLLSLVRDVSERTVAERKLREREAQLRLASEVARLGAWTADVRTGEFRWSEELCRLFGFPLNQSPTREQALAAYSAELQEQLIAKGRTCVSEGAPFEIEAEATARDGTRMWVRLIGQLERDDDGQPVRLHGTVQDISEQRRLHEELRHAQKMEAVGQLAGGIAHDFNNLLSVMFSYADIVQNRLPLDSPLREDLQQIRRAADRAAGLTRQLLAFSRRQILKPEVVSIAKIVAAIQPMLQRLLGEHVEITLALTERLGHVRADPIQIEQILLNLCVNARDAMPNGGKLHIESANARLDAEYTALHPGLEPGEYVMLAITDTGTGMDAAIRSRIFEPFFTTKEVGKGTGLGLSTVFGIVKQSRGHISVYSEPGHGTSFRIYLPRCDDPVRESDAPRQEPASLLGKETVLVVEDDEQVRSVVTQLLRQNGYRVLVAAQGHEAERIAEAQLGAIDLLITDVVMPRMSGRELATRLLARRPHLKVLYVSGYTEGAIVSQGILDDGIDFLHKPITPGSLYRKIRQVLDAPAD